LKLEKKVLCGDIARKKVHDYFYPISIHPSIPSMRICETLKSVNGIIIKIERQGEKKKGEKIKKGTEKKKQGKKGSDIKGKTQ